ncbi:MAG: hypothetical protein JJ895_02480 [Balneolaceae bacterium]|nr:hypothetical protein [Balneolaceae bacterium]
MIILCPNTEGHYGYYIKLLEKKNKVNSVISHKDLSFKLIFKELQSEKLLLLNFWAILKKKPIHYLLIILMSKRIGQFIYNLEFIHKSDLKSKFLFIFFSFLKHFRSITSFTLVEHDINTSLGLSYIPDPIELPNQSTNNSDRSNEYNIPEEYILLFGSHDERKGTYEFLKFYSMSINVLVVGKIHDLRILEFSEKKGVYIINGFVDENLKHVLFEKAKCIAIPYQDWFGSSGVLGTAISYEKVIFGPPHFFIGNVLKSYNRSIIGSVNDSTSLVNIDNIVIEKLYKESSNSSSILDKYFSETTFQNEILSWSH